MTEPTILTKIGELFTWVLAKVGDLITFITGQDLLVYFIGIIFISFIIGVLVRLLRSRA